RFGGLTYFQVTNLLQARTDHWSAGGKTLEQVRHLEVRQAAEPRNRHAGGDGRIEAVHVKADEVAGGVWSARDKRGRAKPAHLLGANQDAAERHGGVDVAKQRGSRPTQADVNHGRDAGKLRHAAHGAVRSIAHTVDLLA